MSNNNEENIIYIERYINDKLSKDERKAFENRLELDDEFKKLFEQHKLLIESVQLSYYTKEKQKLKKIHRDILDEGREEKKEAKIKPIFPSRWILSIAAIFLLGLSAGYILFQQTSQSPGKDRPIASLENESGENFGGESAGLPLIEGNITLIFMATDQGDISRSNQSILFSLYESTQNQIGYKLDNNSIEIYIPNASQLEVFDPFSTQLILQKIKNPNLEIALLNLSSNIYQIPLTNEDFNVIFNR